MDQSHWEMIFTSLEQRLRDVCNSVKSQNEATNNALVQMAGLAHRLDTLEAEVAALKQRRGMGFHLGPEAKKALIPVGIIILLTLLNAPDNHIGWVISFLK